MKIRKAIIPAAGFGTRMLPASKSVPKEMLTLVDKPVIQYIVEEAVAAGIEEILIITSRGKQAVEDFFDYAPDLEEKLLSSGKEKEYKTVRKIAELADIHFLRQKEMKGLGHAVLQAKNFVGNEPFAVLLGDDIMYNPSYPVIKQLIDCADKYNASCVGVKYVDNENIGKYCSLKVDQLEDHEFKVFDMIEKPKPTELFSNYAILGRYVLKPEIFDILKDLTPGFGGEIQLTDGLAKLAKKAPMVACEFDGVRYDTGNLMGYLDATVQLALKHPEFGEKFKNYITSVVENF